MSDEYIEYRKEEEETPETGGHDGWKELWTKEDYWAIWLGFALIVVALLVFLPRPPEGMNDKLDAANTAMAAETDAPFKTVAWHEANDAKKKIKASSESHAKAIAKWIAKPHGWKTNPGDAFWMSEEKAAGKKEAADATYAEKKADSTRLRAPAVAAEAAARDAAFKDDALNDTAREAITLWRDAKARESGASKKAKVSSFCQVHRLIVLCVFLAVFFSIGVKFMGDSVGKFLLAFPFVFAFAVFAYMFEAQNTMKHLGIGYAAWAILFGLLISNTVGTPKWVMPAVQTEYYIKTGLVLLGAEILFSKIVAIGTPGIFVAWIVTPIVLVTTYIFGQYVLKIPSKTLNMTISADMSVCGVSAAIATASACRAKKEELTLAVGMSLVFTSIMMIVMPVVIKSTNMPAVLGGAWMGGTIDATGAVAAAGAALGDTALQVAATIKMIQNVLIGVTAFCVALYWTMKVDNQTGQKVGAMEIWYRFPKFVLGFIAASIIFSLIYSSLGSDAGYTLIDNGVIRGFTKTFRGWFFCMAFVSIGLATNFRELRHYFKGGKPLILYVCGQSFNLCLTLLMAYIMFYVVFKEITENL